MHRIKPNAYVDVVSVEEAEKAVCLSGEQLKGSKLKVAYEMQGLTLRILKYNTLFALKLKD